VLGVKGKLAGNRQEGGTQVVVVVVLMVEEKNLGDAVPVEGAGVY